MTNSYTITQKPLVLPALKTEAIVVQAVLLISAAFVLPSLAHLTGLPVRWLLPMHWPVILAGLCYGWRSGALIGIAAPLVSFGISGMPPAFLLPAMAAELAAYGFVAGFLRERYAVNGQISVLASILSGRAVFIAVAFMTGVASTGFGDYLTAAMLPGLPAAAAQAILLPLIATWWVAGRYRQERSVGNIRDHES